MKWRRLIPYFFISPFFILYGIFSFVPTVSSIYLSFFKWQSVFKEPQFVGLANYLRMFNDKVFWISMYNTFYYLVVYNIVMISMALILALLLNYPSTKLKRVFRTVYFLPITFSLVLVAFTFEMVYHKDFGLLNQVLHLIGLNIQFDWLRDINLALNALISMRVWRVVGFYMIIILAGLQSIPQSLYEVAEIDGANIFQKVIHITIPLLIPTLLLVIVMSTVWSFQLFTEPWLLTQGGPAYATETIALYTYKNAFLYSDFGYASALATVMALIIIFVSMLQIRFLWQKGGLA